MYELFIGLRYTLARRRNNSFISFISFISIAGIALGVAALIVVLSVMNGFQKEVRDRILGMAAHVQIGGGDNMLENTPRIEKLLNANPYVIASAPFVLGQALLINRDHIKGVIVRGIDPAQEGKVSTVARSMRLGQLNDLKPGRFTMMVGQQLASDLGVTVGDSVTVMLPQTQTTPGGIFPRLRRFEIKGVFRADYYPYDTGLVLIDLDDAKTLFREQAMTGLRLKLNDLFAARFVSKTLARQLPGFWVSDWTEENPSYFRAVEIEKRMMFIILTLIIAVAAFNLVSTLVMMVTDKQADIAILRTLGAQPRSIMAIFMLQGVFSGLAGTLSGVLLGVGLTLNLDVIVPSIEKLLGGPLLSPDVYLLTEVPTDILAADILHIGVLSLFLALMATLYPSWRASRIHPTDALRYE